MSTDKEILIDCSYLYKSRLNTGIQRVLRNITENIGESSAGYSYRSKLVVLKNGHIFEIDLPPYTHVESKRKV